MPSHLRQSGLAETFEHVGVIPGPYPRRAPTEIHVEGGWRDCDGLFKRYLRRFEPTELTEGGGEPTVCVGKLGV